MNEQRPTAPTTPAPSIKPPAAIGSDTSSLVMSDAGTVQSSSKIKMSSEVSHIGSKMNRQPNINHTGACRVKSFIGKVSGTGMEYMDNTINVWLDAHPEIEVKFVTSTFGQLDGKVERAIITSVWY
jgi:hypothetical protein